MDAILSASLIAAFLAGMVALFAPCCITVLLPAYLGAAFREKKHILRMTFVFFAGIAVILIPVGLGAAWLAEVFQDFHTEMYIVGGLFMIALAVMAIRGRGLAMIPLPKKMAAPGNGLHAKSVFALGLFSGAATSCCAPVLAGAVTLAVISGTFWKALLVTFAYVFGMTFPLFLAAFFYDRYQVEKSRFIRGKMWEFHVCGKSILVHSTNFIAGMVFLAMGIILLTLAFSGNAFWAPSMQTSIGTTLNSWAITLNAILKRIPEPVWALLIGGSFVGLVFAAFRKYKSE